ncbi:CRISPR-associated protein Cas5 [Desulfolucanica intricata]|uniref:CRISPR-associated protein Cas5 n=1 Tax=Desulfolucanica intricata TaxID=1285191 RepID=UPI000831082E|nr:CRISPR-associated protein Cas5 [Desulfolucanica intricata]
MYYFILEIYAPTASFRLPETHTFQQTLPLPPVTTLMGLAGAALGLSFEQAMSLRENGLLCGIWGRHEGEASDLWKFQKIKSGEVISAVLTREILYNLELYILYAHKDRKITEEIRKAFLCPVYALSAGTSDDLIKLRRIGEINETDSKPCWHYECTILPGDHSENLESSIKPENLPIIKSIRPPRVFLLPVSFTFSGEARRVKNRAYFTFIDTPVTLNQPVTAIVSEGRVFPLL